MHKIELGKGHNLFALVDDADYPKIKSYHWFGVRRSHTTYVACDPWDPIKKERLPRIYMHRLIMSAPATLQVDHINGDGLDNRRCNLRLVTARKNAENYTKPTKARSGYRGVRQIDGGNWSAYININGEQIYLGLWPTIELAASARDYAVIDRGLFMKLNFPEGQPESRDWVEIEKLEHPTSEHPNIRFKNDAYEAWARAGGKRVYVGRYPTLEEAIEAQELFIDAGVKKKLPPKNISAHPNISRRRDGWKVLARVNGKKKYVGQYDTLEKAIEAQELFIDMGIKMESSQKK